MGSGERSTADDFASLGDRIAYLLAIRLGFVIAALAIGILASPISGGLTSHLVVPIGAYAALEAGLELIRRRGDGPRLGLLAAGLLLDGLFLVWLIHLTGGERSPFQSLIVLHLIAAMLLASYRTGLKIAVWDTLVFVVVIRADQVGLLAERAWLPASTIDAATTRLIVIDVVAIWVLALVAALLSAVNERVLRRKRADLEALAAIVGAIDGSASATEIPGNLLDGLADQFGFARGAVLASPDGELEVIAIRGPVDPIEEDEPTLHGAMERAFSTRSVQTVRSLDPEADRTLDRLLPAAHNVLVAPLFLDGGFRLGVVAFEAGRGRNRIRRWDVSIVQQAAAHAALALHKAWLQQENQERLDEISRLRDELLGQNLRLESAVIERTHELDGRLAELGQAHDERRRLLSYLVTAQEDERRRIAGDIHDDPVQRLAALNMHLQLARDDSTEPAVQAKLRKLSGDLRDVMRGLRSLTFELHPSILDEIGLAAALHAYTERFEMSESVEIDDRLSEDPPTGSRMVLYRVAQEALANIRKHANASRVSITIERRGSDYLVRVVDDGAGFAPSDVARSRPGHLGLSSMRERAEMIGGGCLVHSLPGGGTTVECWVPTVTAEPDGSGEDAFGAVEALGMEVDDSAIGSGTLDESSDLAPTSTAIRGAD